MTVDIKDIKLTLEKNNHQLVIQIISSLSNTNCGPISFIFLSDLCNDSFSSSDCTELNDKINE
jgi:hypothetical protein